jgi:hypothetical protein
MNLADARLAVQAAIARMNVLYHSTLFDEWVLVSIKPDRGTILAYSGPRAETYKRNFATDLQPLRAELDGQKLAAGDFAFAASATGTQHDACMRLGAAGYLFCNNTAKTMDEIRTSPFWREAQKPFVELSEKFHADPLE